MKVLIVEDSRTMRFYLEKLAISLGHEARICETAEAAIEEFNTTEFSLVITDWVLPGMDGLTLVKHLRQHERGEHCIIIMITSRKKLEDLEAVLAAGADDYIAKPVSEDILKTRLIVAERMAFNLTERKRMEAQLRHSLEISEILLKEIHHRVKNNLMIVASLLSLQSRRIEDEEAQEAFIESRNRVNAMSMIHERLYGSTDLTSVDVPEFFHSLASQLFQSYNISSDRITLELLMPQMSMDVQLVVPLTLIVNEVLTNSLKHAFADGRQGHVSVELRREGQQYELVVRDNGVGIESEEALIQSGSLGMKIVHSLSSQIDGKTEFRNEGGLVFTLRFKAPKFG